MSFLPVFPAAGLAALVLPWWMAPASVSIDPPSRAARPGGAVSTAEPLPRQSIVVRRPASELPHFLRLHATSLAVDAEALGAFASAGGGRLPAVPLDALTALDLDLRPRSPWAPAAQMDCVGKRTRTQRRLGGEGGGDAVYLSGSVAGVPGSTAFLAATAAGVFGFVDAGQDRWIISSGPHGAGLPTVAYRASDLPPGLIESPEWLCHAADLAGSTLPAGDGGVAGTTCRQLRLAIDTDHALFTIFSGDLAALEGYLGTIASALDTILSRDLAMQVSVTHLRIFTEDNDPWPDTTLNAQIATLYTDWVPELDSVERDAVQLLCATPLGGGIAYIDGICSDYAYSVVGNVTGYFPTPLLNNVAQNWDIFASAHELGHNLTMPHTHSMQPPADGCGSSPQDCGAAIANAGTLMSYCHLCAGGLTNIRLEYHPQSIAHAQGYLDSAPCDFSGATLPPVAVSDTARVFPGTPVKIDVLANEWDGNCEAILISSFDATSAHGGTVTRSVGTGPGGRDELVYSIARGSWVGLDSFSYTVVDSSGQGATAQVILEVLEPRVPENPIGASAGLAAAYYTITSEVVLPNFALRTPYATTAVASLDYPASVGGFASSGRTDHVGARFTGWITVPESGAWDFFLTSDEGARVSIGSRVVVNHDGLHSFTTRMGTVALDAGTHAITVDYFERTGTAGLRLAWRSPDGIFQTVPASAYSFGGADTRADIDNDGRVNASDVTAILASWGSANASSDVTGDGVVGPQDLATVLFEWTG